MRPSRGQPMVPLVRLISPVTRQRHRSGTHIARTTRATSHCDAMSKRLSVYVVYPAALFDGWEVVENRDDDSSLFFDTREGAIVKLENWFGDTEQVWEVAPPKVSPRRGPRSPAERPPPRSADHAPERTTAGSMSGRRGG